MADSSQPKNDQEITLDETTRNEIKNQKKTPKPVPQAIQEILVPVRRQQDGKRFFLWRKNQ